MTDDQHTPAPSAFEFTQETSMPHDSKQPPDSLWLQWWDEDGNTPQHIDGHDTGATWCDDKVHATDVLYVRAGAAPAAYRVDLSDAQADLLRETLRKENPHPLPMLMAPTALPADHVAVPLDILSDVARLLFVGHASDPASEEAQRLRKALYSIIGKARGI